MPDGTQKHFDHPVSLQAVAMSIGAGLAKAAIAAKVDSHLVDLSTVLAHDAAISIITAKSEEALEVIRHSTAHLLAQAVQAIYPEAQVTIGPVIDDGFYYDFAFERPFTPEDLVTFEKKMHELAKQDLAVRRIEVSRNEAIERFKAMGEQYKVEIIEAIPETEVLSLYEQGSFVDLCRGPHVPSTQHLKAFKLMKVAGAYWRGDSNKAMLQRIYGTAFADQKALDAYLFQLEESAKRDHRKIGKKHDLFHIQDIAPGMVFWHPNGWIVYQVIEQYVRDVLRRNQYEEVRTPALVDSDLWQRSGHSEKFRENMFFVETDERESALKPMNCPCHVQIFNQGLRSYRELPLRMAEFGSCHRNEPSGALHGLMRVRGFTQDDGHIFCTESQIQAEVLSFMDLLFSVYEDFGFTEVLIKLSTRPEKRVGSDEIWDKAEVALQEALDKRGLQWQLLAGEGAFYGPKIEFSLKDCLGRVWQCGTVQVDFNMPERLGAEYVAEDGSRQVPVMLHRATLGSLERFIGILIEEYAGSFPVWLAPIQMMVMALTDRQQEYAQNVCVNLLNNGFRSKTDLRNEKIGFKIREHTLMRVPYLLVLGDKEVAEGTVSVRTREGEDLGAMPLSSFVTLVEQAIVRRGRR